MIEPLGENQFPTPGMLSDAPVREREVLEFWRDAKIFERSLEQTKHGPRYTIYEGPPTANGRPGVHHVLARTFKDLYPRFWTMRGKFVRRKAGWDTHGLPVEHQVEKEIGILDKSRLEAEVGIAEFNRRCRESVFRYVGDWNAMTERMALLGRPRASVLHAGQHVHRDGLVAAQAALGSRAHPARLQIGALRSAHRRDVVRRRSRARLSRDGRSVGVRPLPPRGRSVDVDPRMDDDAVDVAREHGAGGASRRRVRSRRTRRRKA